MNMWGEGITFKKTGREIKVAAQERVAELQKRLVHRESKLEEFMNDRNRMKHYILRVSAMEYDNHDGMSYIPRGRDDISQEEVEDTVQLCKRIMQLRNAIQTLQLTITHLADDETCELSMREFISHGFQPGGIEGQQISSANPPTRAASADS